MALNSNPNRTSLVGRVAASKRQAAETKQLKMRVASAWTLAKTMIPTAPPEIQVRVAKTLLQNGTRELKAMLRQAAVNAHFTRLAEEFKNVHKMDLNDLMDPESSLTKEWNAVLSEMKGKAKDASAKKADDRKVADDRKENGVQPATYDEGKRKEPADMDADGAGDRPKVDKEMKEGSVKTTAAQKQGCGNCDGDQKAPEPKGAAAAKKADELAHKGEPAPTEPAQTPLAKGTKDASKTKTVAAAATKKAEDEGDEEEMKEASAKSAKPVKAAPKSKKAEDEAKDEAPPAEEATEEMPAEEEESPVAEGDESGDKPGEEEAPEEAAEDDLGEDEEVFDEEKVTLEDAIEDVKADVETLTEAIEAEIGDADEINLDEMGLAEGDPAQDAMGDMQEDPFLDPAEPAELPAEELNMDSIFDEDAMADKVSALANEDVDTVAMEFDDMFSNEPSDAEALEALLDPETEESPMSPVDMFAVSGQEAADPMAMLFASQKVAADDTILKPGTLDKHFETELAGDDRDWESDHEGDIFSDVLRSLKQPETDQTRVQQDREPALKEPADAKMASKVAAQKTAPVTKKAVPAGKAPVVQAAQKPLAKKPDVKLVPKKASYPKLAPHFDPLKDAIKVTGGNLAAALFPDEADFM